MRFLPFSFHPLKSPNQTIKRIPGSIGKVFGGRRNSRNLRQIIRRFAEFQMNAELFVASRNSQKLPGV